MFRFIFTFLNFLCITRTPSHLYTKTQTKREKRREREIERGSIDGQLFLMFFNSLSSHCLSLFLSGTCSYKETMPLSLSLAFSLPAIAFSLSLYLPSFAFTLSFFFIYLHTRSLSFT